MSKAVHVRPQTDEYAEFYSGYISKVPGEDPLAFLEQQLESAVTWLRGVADASGDLRYEPGKWSVKEVIGHIIDTERVFAYRALVFARGDRTPLPGFDQDPWAQHANYANVPMRDITAEFEAVRRATILLFRQLDSEAWSRRGIGNNKEMTVRAVAFIIGGHTQHHLDILKARYRI
jgi:DinB superfamily